MRHVRISELKAKLSSYLAAVRRGESVVVRDRSTPVAVLVPYEDGGAGLTIDEPSASLRDLEKTVRGVRPRRSVDVVALLRDSRDER